MKVLQYAIGVLAGAAAALAAVYRWYKVWWKGI